MAEAQPVLKGGYLHKQGSLWRSWKHRYFSLTASSLNYYAQAGDAAPKGAWSLSGCQVHDAPAIGPRAHILVLTNLAAGSSLRMQAERAEDKASWIAALQHNIHLLDAPNSARRRPKPPGHSSGEAPSGCPPAPLAPALPLAPSATAAPSDSTHPPVAAKQTPAERTYTAGGSTVPAPPLAPSRAPSTRPTRRSTALGRISVFCTTWNMGEGSLDPAHMSAWLPRGRDVYGIALQEALDPAHVADEVQKHLGRSYITISHAIGNANTQLGYHGFISVLVCVHEALISSGVALPSVAQRREVRLGRNLVVTRAGNKGAVAVVLPLRLPDQHGMLTRLSSFTFVACHLASDSKGASKLASRNGDAEAMLAGLQIGFPTGTPRSTAEHPSLSGSGAAPVAQRDVRSISMGPLHTAAAEAADAALAATSPSSDSEEEGGGHGFTSGSGAGAGDAGRPLPGAASRARSTSAGRGDSTDRGRSSTLFFPLGRGDSVIRGRQSTTGSAAPPSRASGSRQQLLSVGTRGSAVSTVRFFTGDAVAASGGAQRTASPEPFPSESPLHRSDSDEEEWTAGGGVRPMGGGSTEDPASRGGPSAAGSSIPRDGSDWSPSDMAAAILNGYVFMCGDLNYRVKMSPEQAVLLVAKGESRRVKGGLEPPLQTMGHNHSMLRAAAAAVSGSRGARGKGMPLPDWLDPERPWRRIILMEELRAEMTWGNLWLGWEEAAICFPPTYRRVRDMGAVLRRVRGDYADLNRVAHGYATHLAKGGGILHGRAALPFLAGKGGAGGVTLSPAGAATLDGPLIGSSPSRRGSRAALRPALSSRTSSRGRQRGSSVATRDLVMQMPKGARGGKAAAWLGASERRVSKGGKGGQNSADAQGEDSDSADSVTSVASAGALPSSSRLGGGPRPGIQFASGTRGQDGSASGAARKGAASGELSRVPSVRTRAFVSLGGGSDDEGVLGELTHLDVPLQPHLLSPPAKPADTSAKKPAKKFRLSLAPGAASPTSSGPKTRRRSVMPTALGGAVGGSIPEGGVTTPVSAGAPPQAGASGRPSARQGGGGSQQPTPSVGQITPSKPGTFKRLRQSIVGGGGMSSSTRTLRVGSAGTLGSDEGGLDEGVKITTRTPSYTDRILLRRPLSQQPPVVRAQVLPDWVMPGGVGPRSSMFGALTSLRQPGTGQTMPQEYAPSGERSGVPMHPRTGTLASDSGVHVRSHRAASDGSTDGLVSGNLFDSARASGTALAAPLGRNEPPLTEANFGSVGGVRMGTSDVLVPLPVKPPVLPPLVWSRYDMADEVLGSDHVPVIAEFELDLNASVRGTPDLGTRMGGLLSQGGTVACELLEASSALQRVTAKEAERSGIPTAGGAPLHPMQDGTAVLAAQLHSLREKIPPPPPQAVHKPPPSPPFRPDSGGKRHSLGAVVGVQEPASPPTPPSVPAGDSAGSFVSGGSDSTRLAMRMSVHSRSLGAGMSDGSMDSSGAGGGGSDTVSSSLGGGGSIPSAPPSPSHTGAQQTLSKALLQHLCDPARIALGTEIRSAHTALKLGGAAGAVAGAGGSAVGAGPSALSPAADRTLLSITQVQEPTVDELFETLLPSKPTAAVTLPPAARRVTLQAGMQSPTATAERKDDKQIPRIAE